MIKLNAASVCNCIIQGSSSNLLEIPFVIIHSTISRLNVFDSLENGFKDVYKFSVGYLDLGGALDLKLL